jgi:transketolase
MALDVRWEETRPIQFRRRQTLFLIAKDHDMTTNNTPSDVGTMAGKILDLARRLAMRLRVDFNQCSTQAGSGHPTFLLSAADLMAVLLLHNLRYNWANASQATNEHLIFFKGQASPLLNSM